MNDDAKTLLDGLLGTGSDEVGCDECLDLLDLYVEAANANPEAASLAHPRMAAHLAGCPVCHDEYRALADLVAGASGAHEQRPER